MIRFSGGLFFVAFLLCPLFVSGQFRHEDVFKGQRDDVLFQSLITTFKTSFVLNYDVARDTLFAKVDAVGDSLECIYSGHRLYLPPDQDPTQAVFLNGIPNGINTEHAYPQSKGASGMGRSDMHHLYPTRIRVNSDRMSNPLGEIPDNTTRFWYFRDMTLTNIPSVNRDWYSESTLTRFEPRESVKGDIARAIFYFYTMYRQDANNADPNFFNIQRADLCEWHYHDPVDQKEWERTHKIAFYQDGKRNPFVLDCSLAARLYCNNLSQECEEIISSSVHDAAQDSKAESLKVYPNPADQYVNVSIEVNTPDYNRISLTDILGRELLLIYHGFLPEGQHIWPIHNDWGPGVYFIRMIKQNGFREVQKCIFR